jgi:hypothetical protein
MLCLLHDESIMNVTKNKKYKNLKRRDQQQAALESVVCSSTTNLDLIPRRQLGEHKAPKSSAH